MHQLCPHAITNRSRRCRLHLLILSTLFLLLIPFLSSVAQSRYYTHWYFGYHVGIDFSRTPPSLVYGELNTSEGCASISDPVSGNLLFYTDGTLVYNRNGEIMPNGAGLFGHSTSAQSAVIVPFPGDPQHYYIFTAGAGPYIPNNLVHGINVSVVDMTADGGLGDVISKNRLLLGVATEQLVAIRNCNGRDYWVLGHQLGNAQFYAWRVTCDGIDPRPVISNTGQVYSGAGGSIATLKASPDGYHLAATSNAGYNELLNFNPVNGAVTGGVILGFGGYGSSFSPNSQYLFLGTERFTIGPDVPATQTTIAVSTTLKSRGYTIQGMQLGPDGAIYCSGNIEPSGAITPALLKIIDPDGSNPTLVNSGFNFSGNQMRPVMGLPNNIDGYLASKPVPICDDDFPLDLAPLDTMLCPGDVVRPEIVEPMSGMTYSWTFEGAIPEQQSGPYADPVTYRTPGRYRIIVEGRKTTCHVNADTVYVTVFERPRLEGGAGRTICAGDSVQLHAEGEGSVEWISGEGLSCTTCSDPIARPQRSTLYQVRLTNEAGCSTLDTVRVDVVAAIELAHTPDTSICAGQSLQLNVSGGERYQWTSGGTLSCDTCDNPVVSPSTTTTYVVRGRVGSSCEAIDSVVVTVLSTPSINVGSDLELCRGERIQLGATVAEPGVDYLWSPQTGLDDPNRPVPVASPVVSTTYYLTATNRATGCRAIDSVHVALSDRPVLRMAPDQSLCRGSALTLASSPAEVGVTYRWSPATGLDDPTSAQPSARPERGITYRVIATSAGGCEAIDSVSITIIEPPSADAGPDRLSCRGSSLQIGTPPVPGLSYQWSPATGLSDARTAQPVATAESTTNYQLTVFDPATGCSSYDTVLVTVPSTLQIVTSIAETYTGYSDELIAIRVEADRGPDSRVVNRLPFVLEYNPSVLQVETGAIQQMLDSALLQGWDVTIVSDEPGRLELEFRAVSPASPSGSGPLFYIPVRLYIGQQTGTDLHYSFPGYSDADDACITINTDPGYAQLGSLCGLNLRLIELGFGRYAPPTPLPNPSGRHVAIEFGLGLDGPTRLEIFNAEGRLVGVVVDDYLQEGTYRVEWDGGESGTYWLHLTTGTWTGTARLLIRE